MIKSLILYFQFFTRIPFPFAVDKPVKRMRTGAKYFTFFGLLIGFIEVAVFVPLQYVLGPMLAWVLTLFFDVLLTGGFHLDALSDMADGLFSSRKKERMLEIMKDSRVGSNGVLALVFYYALLFFTFQGLIGYTTDISRALMVLTLNLVGKSGICLLFYEMVYAGATPNGLGASFLKIKTSAITIAQAFSLLILALTFRIPGIVGYGVMLVFVFFYRRFVLNKVEGFNGDTLGASSPLCQAVFLIVLLAMRGFL